MILQLNVSLILRLTYGGMAQVEIPDFSKMQNSNSAIPINLSLNADRNARGKAEDDHGRKKNSGGRPAEGWPPPTVLFSAVLILCQGSP